MDSVSSSSERSREISGPPEEDSRDTPPPKRRPVVRAGSPAGPDTPDTIVTFASF